MADADLSPETRAAVAAWRRGVAHATGDMPALPAAVIAAGLAAAAHLHGAAAVRRAAEQIPDEPASGVRAWLTAEADRLAAGMVVCECEPPWHFRGVSRCIHPDEQAPEPPKPDIGAAAQLVLDGRVDMAVQARAAWLHAAEGWDPGDERIEDLKAGSPPEVAEILTIIGRYATACMGSVDDGPANSYDMSIVLRNRIREMVKQLVAELARLREENEQQRAVIGLGYDRAREATERWKAEDSAGRKDVLFADAGSLLAWLMAEVDKARAVLDGIAWLELDNGHPEPRLTVTGEMETLRAIAARLPAAAPEEHS